MKLRNFMYKRYMRTETKLAFYKQKILFLRGDVHTLNGYPDTARVSSPNRLPCLDTNANQLNY